MMRNLGGAVGIAVNGAILNDRTNFHFQAIASNLTPANGAMTRLLTEVAQRYGAILAARKAGMPPLSTNSGASPTARRRPWPTPTPFSPS